MERPTLKVTRPLSKLLKLHETPENPRPAKVQINPGNHSPNNLNQQNNQRKNTKWFKKRHYSKLSIFLSSLTLGVWMKLNVEWSKLCDYVTDFINWRGEEFVLGASSDGGSRNFKFLIKYGGKI
jgi:hypothetical protein